MLTICEETNNTDVKVCGYRVNSEKTFCKEMLQYLSLGMGDPQKMDGCLENLAAMLILQGSAVNIGVSGMIHRGVLDIQEGQNLPVSRDNRSINVAQCL